MFAKIGGKIMSLSTQEINISVAKVQNLFLFMACLTDFMFELFWT